MSSSCPMCGRPIAILIRPEDNTQLVPIATIACVSGMSCGWSVGMWSTVELIEVLAEKYRAEQEALTA